MNTGFRLVLRTALVLVLLAGVALVVYAIAVGSPTESTTASSRNATAPAAHGTTPVVEPDTAPATAVTPASKSNGGSSEPASHHGRLDVEFEHFHTVLHSGQDGRREAVITGDKGIPKDQFLEVIAPVVDLLKASGDIGPVDAQVKNVHITARRCLLAADESGFRLSEDVTAQGEGFKIATQSVAYSAKERTLTSGDPVRIEGQEKRDDDTPAVTMILEGDGLFADVTVNDMSILRNVKARLIGVSEDFLASGTESAGDDGEEKTDVVITCTGPMNYEHMARRVVFRGSVKAVSGNRTLTCDRLTIVLAKGDSTDTAEVEQLDADTNVWLRHEGLSARGDRLEWNQVLQTGLLTGDPEAIIWTPQFDLSGRKLTLHRVSERVECNGPGQLYWKAESGEPEPPAAEDADAPSSVGVQPIGLTGDKPVTVKWQERMIHVEAENRAVFTGSVTAAQGGITLGCGQLALEFDPLTKNIEKVRADGDVRLHDAESALGRDILCQQMVWSRSLDTIELTAPEGGVVNVVSDNNVISSPHVTLDNRTGVLACPAPGTLTVRPEGASDDDEPQSPLTVEWQESMELSERPTPRAVFLGGAVAVHGTDRMAGQSLSVDLDADRLLRQVVAQGDAVIDLRSASRPAGDEGEPNALGMAGMQAHAWHLEAGEITVRPPEKTITSQTAGTLTVTGEEEAGTITWQDSMQVNQQDGQATFTGQATAEMSGAILESESLKLEFTPEHQKMRHIWAEGGVSFTNLDEDAWNLKAESARAIFDADGEMRQIIAQGKVDVQATQYTLASDVLTLHTAPNAEEGKPPPVVRAVAEGDVRVTYREKGLLQADGDRLTWDRETDVFVLTGDPTATVRQDGLARSTSRIEFDRTTGQRKLRTGRIRTRATTDPL